MKRSLAGIALGAAMLGARVAVPTTVQQPIPKPGFVATMPRRKRIRFEARMARTNKNRAGQRANRADRDPKIGDELERHLLIKGMSNNSRHHWARAGYPQDLKAIRAYRYGELAA